MTQHPDTDLRLRAAETKAYRAGLEAALATILGKSREGREWMPESAFASLRAEIAAEVQAMLDEAQKEPDHD